MIPITERTRQAMERESATALRAMAAAFAGPNPPNLNDPTAFHVAIFYGGPLDGEHRAIGVRDEGLRVSYANTNAPSWAGERVPDATTDRRWQVLRYVVVGRQTFGASVPFGGDLRGFRPVVFRSTVLVFDGWD